MRNLALTISVIVSMLSGSLINGSQIDRANAMERRSTPTPIHPHIPTPYPGERASPGSTGSGSGRGQSPPVEPLPSEPIGSTTTRGLRILSKPKPNYTDQARIDQVQGTVVLEVTFLANGTIGKVRTIKGLGGGLTKSAITAVKQIKFEPAVRNGKLITTKNKMEYSFAVY